MAEFYDQYGRLWAFEDTAPSSVKTMLWDICRCGCVWRTHDSERGDVLWSAGPLPCPHRQTWRLTVEVDGVSYVPKLLRDFVDFGSGFREVLPSGAAVAQYPNDDFMYSGLLTWSKEDLKKAAWAAGAADAEAVGWWEDESGTLERLDKLVRFCAARIRMEEIAADLEFPQRSSAWRDEARAAEAARQVLAEAGIDVTAVEAFVGGVIGEGYTYMGEVVLWPKVAEWYDQNRDDLEGDATGGVNVVASDDDAAAELDRILDAGP